MLDALGSRGVRVAAVVVEAATALDRCRRARTRPARVLETPVAIARSLWRRLRAASLRWSSVQRGVRTVVVADRNSPRARAKLATLLPDVLVLAGVGLVDASVLAIPRLGAVNGHPGLLPWVRGNGVVRHALLRGVAIGATCHLVDPGIDTGPILARRLLAVAEPAPLPALERAAVDLARELTADVVAATVRGSALPPGVPQTVRYPLCRWRDLPPRSTEGDASLATQASRLFQRWRALCVAGSDVELPADLDPTASA